MRPPVIDHEFRHNIVNVAVDPRGDSRVDPQFPQNKLTSVLYASVLLLMINVIITLSTLTAEPPTRASWLHSHFDNVMTQFIINKRTEAFVI